MIHISNYKTIAVINEPHKIFLAQNINTGKIYAKKVLDVYNIDVYNRLYQTPVIGTPKIIDYAQTDSTLTIVEEYISGESLHDKIENGTLSVNEIINYMVDLCDTLSRLHSMNPPIIHRDIKPSNVIISSCGHAILLDFNAAKCYSSDSEKDTVLLGTQGYAAPEQYGFGSSSPQTDIYSLGILLQEMLDSIGFSSKHFDDIINKCTRVNVSERYANVQKLKEALTNTQKTHKSNLAKFTPPGYRTKTPWKMLLATVGYIIILWLCTTIEFDNCYGIELWGNRIILLSMFLSTLFSCFNYMDIQRLIPFCKHKNKIIHYVGIAILVFVLLFCLMLLLIIFETVFFPK
jgi:serine/threonine protein kinase